MSLTETFKQCQEHFLDWLGQGMSGCHFASTFTKKPLRYDFHAPIGSLNFGLMEDFIDGTADRKEVAVLLFPKLRRTEELVELIVSLKGHPRWKLEPKKWPEGFEQPLATPFSLRWKTKAGPESEAMGLSPLGTMPVTRRAPYTAIVLWAGPHLNEHIKQKETVGVASSSTSLGPDEHRNVKELTEARVVALLQQPAEKMSWLRRIAFILPERDCGPLDL